MFGVANSIAYAGMMVSAKKDGQSPIRSVFGPSCWMNVEGSFEDKWCEEEGALVLSLLRQLAAARVEPDLYVITPFVIVAERLRRLVRESGVLDGWVSAEGLRDWASDRIGTVHTAQGREAEAVIFVLGATSQARAGTKLGRHPPEPAECCGDAGERSPIQSSGIAASARGRRIQGTGTLGSRRWRMKSGSGKKNFGARRPNGTGK